MHTYYYRGIVAMFSLAFTAAGYADPISELTGFSVFKDVDLAKLAKGEVLAAHGPAMSSPRGSSAQACYVVMVPLQRSVELHEHWSAAKHSELKVFLHGDLPAKPAIENFSKISAAPDNSSVRWLVAATEKLGSGQSPLQMSHEESKLFSGGGNGAGGKGMPGPVAAFWSNLLCRRANSYATGGLSHQPPYELSGEAVRESDEVSRLLKDQPKIANQFSNLSGKLEGAPSNVQLYWELSDIEGQASFSLGAVLGKQAGANWQGLDMQYYRSGGLYTLLTFYQMWPVKIGDREATLVWRGDVVSAASVGELHGVERIASGSAMAREIQKTIGIFLKDVSTSH